MDFGTLIFTKPQRAITDVAFAEARGLTHAWFPDSHMIWGDTYVCMALAALRTKTIKLGTGVAIASNRIPPVTVQSIATINELAPGRVILGFGTGHTGRRVMGLPPVRHAEFSEQARVLRDLLRDGEAVYRTEGLSRKIRYLHRDLRFINLDDRIPLYIAANGPKTLELAGALADGIITTGASTPARIASVRKHVEAGAQRAGRSAAELPIVSLMHVCVLRPGEATDSPRVKAMTGPWVITSLHAIAAGYARESALPGDARPIFAAYADYVARLPGPPDERYLELHQGHCTFVPPREEKFVTAETIAATTMTGRREQIVAQLKELERAGLSQVIFNPPLDGYEQCIDELSSDVISAMSADSTSS